MYTDYIRLFAQNEKRIGHSNIYNKNIEPGYRNGIWHRKCIVYIMKCDKRQITEEKVMSNIKESEHFEKIKTTYSCEFWKRTPSNKRSRKKKITKEYLKRTRKLLEMKLYSRNLIKVINTGVVLLVRYLEPFLK